MCRGGMGALPLRTASSCHAVCFSASNSRVFEYFRTLPGRTLPTWHCAQQYHSSASIHKTCLSCIYKYVIIYRMYLVFIYCYLEWIQILKKIQAIVACWHEGRHFLIVYINPRGIEGQRHLLPNQKQKPMVTFVSRLRGLPSGNYFLLI